MATVAAGATVIQPEGEGRRRSPDSSAGHKRFSLLMAPMADSGAAGKLAFTVLWLVTMTQSSLRQTLTGDALTLELKVSNIDCLKITRGQ